MKLANPVCPYCDQPAVGALETIPVTCAFDGDPREGSVQYGTENVLDWNHQQPIVGQRGDPVVVCVNGHQWETEIDHEGWQARPYSRVSALVAALRSLTKRLVFIRRLWS